MNAPLELDRMIPQERNELVGIVERMATAVEREACARTLEAMRITDAINRDWLNGYNVACTEGAVVIRRRGLAV